MPKPEVPEAGVCALCGQELIRTESDCWHPYTITEPCPPEPADPKMATRTSYDAWQEFYASGRRPGRPGREHWRRVPVSRETAADLINVLDSLPQRLRDAREIRGQSFNVMAARTGLSKGHLHQILNGDRIPTIAILRVLLEWLVSGRQVAREPEATMTLAEATARDLAAAQREAAAAADD